VSTDAARTILIPVHSPGTNYVRLGVDRAESTDGLPVDIRLLTAGLRGYGQRGGHVEYDGQFGKAFIDDDARLVFMERDAFREFTKSDLKGVMITLCPARPGVCLVDKAALITEAAIDKALRKAPATDNRRSRHEGSRRQSADLEIRASDRPDAAVEWTKFAKAMVEGPGPKFKCKGCGKLFAASEKNDCTATKSAGPSFFDPGDRRVREGTVSLRR